MSKVVFTSDLVDRIGLLGDVMASFLEEQVDAIQKRLTEKHPDVDENAAWKTISAFSTLEGTKIPMTKPEVQEQVPYSSGQLDLMLGLFEKARILRLADGIYEIAHDTLALQVSEKRSGEEKALLEIQKLVDDRYGAFIQTGALMGKKELDYISPYQSKLPTTDDQKQFIKKSKKSVRRRRAILLGALIAAFSIISLFAVYALIQQRIAIEKEKEAIENAIIAEKNAKEAERQKIEAEKQKEKAIEAQKEAERQKLVAIKARDAAEKARIAAEAARKRAEQAKKEAEEARDETKKALTKAEAAEKEARAAEAEAKRQEEIAKEEEAKAKAAEAEAKRQRDEAERLRIRALATALAVKSAGMKYDEELKGRLAIEAYNLSSRTADEFAPPEIYTGLYSAVAKFEDEEFDEILEGHGGAIRSIIPANNNTMYSASSDGALLKWSFSDWKDVGKPKFDAPQKLKTSNTVDMNAVLSPNGKWLAIGGKSSMTEIVNTQNNQSIFRNLHNSGDLYDLVFSADNKKLISVGSNKKVQSYNLDNGQSSILITLDAVSEAIAISPTGSILAVGDENGKLELYDMNNLNTPILKSDLGKEITEIAFDDHTKDLAIGLIDGSVSIFNHLNGTYSNNKGDRKTRKAHAQRISDIKFMKYVDKSSKVISTMAIGSYDGSVTVWSLNEFKVNELYEPLNFSGGQKWVMSLAFVNEGKQLSVGYSDGKLKFWPLNTKEVAKQLCGSINNSFDNSDFSKQQMIQYLGEDFTRKQFPKYNCQ